MRIRRSEGRAAFLAMASVGVLAGPVLGADVVARWLNDINGAWVNPARWDSSHSPNNGNGGFTYDAVLDRTGFDYRIQIQQDVTLNRLTIDSPDVELRHLDGILTAVEGIEIQNGALVLRRGTLANTRIAGDGGVFNIDTGFGPAVLDNVTIARELTQVASRGGGARPIVRNGLTLEGAVMDRGGLMVEGDQTFTGTGSFEGYGIQVDGTAILTVDSGLTFHDSNLTSRNGADGHIEFYGKLYGGHLGDAVNHGQLIAEEGDLLFLEDVINLGSIEVRRGDLLLHNPTINEGTFVVEDSPITISGAIPRAAVESIDRRGDSPVLIRGRMDNTGLDLFLDEFGQTVSFSSEFASIVGGRILSTDDNTLIFSSDETPGTISSSVALESVELAGDMEVRSGRLELHETTTLDDIRIDLVTNNGSDRGYLQLKGESQRLIGRGEIVVVGEHPLSGNNQIALSGDVVQVGPDITIRTESASGELRFAEGSVLEGRISAGTPGGILKVFGDFTNTGTMEAIGGGRLHLRGDWDNQGVIRVDEGELFLEGTFPSSSLNGIEVSDAAITILKAEIDNTNDVFELNAQTGILGIEQSTINGGTIRIEPGGGFNLIRFVEFQDVRIEGEMSLDQTISVHDGLEIADGSRVILAQPSGKLGFIQDAAITGQGELVLDHDSAPSVSSSGQLTIGSDITVTVRGRNARLSGGNALVNQAVISVEGEQASLTLLSNWSNQGTIHVNGGQLVLDGQFTTADMGELINNLGRIEVRGMLDNTADVLAVEDSLGQFSLERGTISGGRIDVISELPFSVRGTLDAVSLHGDLEVSQGELTIRNGFTLDQGKILIAGGGNFIAAGQQSIEGQGEIVFNSPGATLSVVGPGSPPMLVLGPDITLRTGTHAGRVRHSGSELINRGLIAPADRLSITIDPIMINEGEIDLTQGDLVASGGWINHGTVRLAPERSLFLGGPTATADLGTIQRDGGRVVLIGELNNTDDVLALPLEAGGRFGKITGGTLAAPLSVPDGSTFTMNDLRFDESVVIDVNGSLTLSEMPSFNGVTFHLSPDDSSSSTVLFADDQVLTGTAQFVLDAPRFIGNHRLQASRGRTLTLGPDIIIRTGNGGGTVGSGQDTIVNQGLIRASTAENQIQIIASQFINEGLIEVDGSFIRLGGNSTQWTNTGAMSVMNNGELALDGLFTTQDIGIIEVESGYISIAGDLDNTGSVLRDQPIDRVVNGKITGGLVDRHLTIESSGRFSNVTLASTLTLETGARGILEDSLPMQDARWSLMGSRDSRDQTILFISSPGALEGSAELVFTGQGNENYIRTGTTLDTLAIGPDIVITTEGQGGTVGWLSGPLLNRGLIRADGTTDADATIRMLGTTSVNEGTIQATNGGTVELPDIDNQSRIEASTQGLILLSGSWVNASEIVVNDAAIELDGQWQNNGTIEVNNGRARLGGVIDHMGDWTVSQSQVEITSAFELGQLAPFALPSNRLDLVEGAILNLSGESLAVGESLSGLALAGGVIRDGSIAASSGRSFIVRDMSELIDVQLAGGLTALEPESELALRGQWANLGTIDLNQATLRLTGQFNPAQIGTITGSGHVVVSGQFDQSGNELVVGGNDLRWRVEDGHILGGRIVGVNDVAIETAGLAVFEDVQLLADIEINTGATAVLTGDWQSEGSFLVNGGDLWLDGDLTITDLGRVVRQGGRVRLLGQLDNSNTVVDLDAAGGSLILEGGRISGGEIIGQTHSLVINPTGGTLEQVKTSSDILAKPFAELRIVGDWALNGQVTLAGGNAPGALFQAFLGANLILDDVSRIDGEGAIHFVDDRSPARIIIQAASLHVGAGIEIQTAGGSGQIIATESAIISNYGTIGATQSEDLLEFHHADIQNFGQVIVHEDATLHISDGAVMNSANLLLGDGGQLILDQQFTQTPEGRLTLRVGPQLANTLQSDMQAHLSGDLLLDPGAAWTPSPNDIFIWLTAELGVTGRFDRVIDHAGFNDFGFEVLYDDTSVSLRAALIGDFDGDGQLSAFDVDEFERALADPQDYQLETGLDPYVRGDMNRDGIFDAFDIAQFEQRLSGSSVGGDAGIVPEPSSLSLLGVSLLATRRRRRTSSHRNTEHDPAQPISNAGAMPLRRDRNSRTHRAMLSLGATVAVATSFLADVTPCVRATTLTSVWDASDGSWLDGERWTTAPIWPDNGIFDFDVRIPGGQASISGDIVVDSLTLGGGISRPFDQFGSLTIKDQWLWTGGFISGILLSVEGDWRISQSSSKNTSAHVDLTGQAIWEGGQINMPGGVIDIAPGATWDTRTDSSLVGGSFSSTGTINNQGHFIKSQGQGTTTVDVMFNNQTGGIVRVETGTLALADGGIHTGEFHGHATTTLGFQGAHIFERESTVQGSVVEFGQGLSDFHGSYDVADVTRITGEVVFHEDAVLTNLGNTLEVTRDATFNIPQTISLQSLALTGRNADVEFAQGYDANELIMEAGDLHTSGESDVLDRTQWLAGTITGSGETHLHGEVNLNGTEQKLLWGHTLINVGNLVWTEGPVHLARHSTFGNAELENAPGATFDIQGDHSLITSQSASTTTFRNFGLLHKSAGEGVANIESRLLNEGTVRVSAGTLKLSGGSETSGVIEGLEGSIIDLASNHDLEIDSALHADQLHISGGLTVVHGELTVQTQTRIVGGQLTIEPSAQVNSVGESLRLENGILAYNNAHLLILGDQTLENSELLVGPQGSVNVRSLTMHDSTFDYASMEPMEIESIEVNQSELSTSSEITISDHLVLNRGSELTGNGQVRIASQAVVELGGEGDSGGHSIAGLTIENQGQWIWGENGRGSLDLTDATFINRPDGSIEFIGSRSGSIGNSISNSTILNEGTIIKGAGEGDLGIGADFDHQGEVRIEGGSFTVTTGQSTGSYEVAADATLIVSPPDGGQHVFLPNSRFYGGGNLELRGDVVVDGMWDITGDTTIFGDITLASDISLQNAQLTRGTLSGSGIMTIEGDARWGRLSVTDGATLRLNGFLRTDDSNERPNINGGRVELAGEWDLRRSLTIQNGGSLTNLPSGLLKISHQNLFGDSTTIIHNRGHITSSSELWDVQLLNDGLIEISGSSLRWEGDLLNRGTITVATAARSLTWSRGQFDLAPGSVVNGEGDLIVDTGGVINLEGVIKSTTMIGGILNGGGRVEGDVTMSGGVISPGGVWIDTLTIEQDLIQTGGGIRIQIAGDQPGISHDQLIVGSDVALDGILTLIFDEAFEPKPGDKLEILTYRQSMMGGFSSIQITGHQPALDFDVTFGGPPLARSVRIQFVPEPFSATIWAAAVATAALRRRRISFP